MNIQQKVQELQTLDPQNPGAWPTWVRIFVVVLVSVAAIAGGLYFAVLPLTEDLDREVAQEQTLRAEFERKQRKVAALDAYKQQLQDMERDFGAMLRQLPSKAEVPNLLNDIAQTRVASSLEEQLFQPRGEVQKEFYAELPNNITVIGTYHELGTFVSAVASLSRIVTVDSVTLRPMATAKGAAAGTPGDLQMTAVIKTYRYLDESEQE